MTEMQDDLDDLLATAARRPVVPTEALMNRVLADGLALQPAAAALKSAPRPGLFARLSGLFGGPPVLAGLGTAAVFGLALGYLSPTTLNYLTGASTDMAEFFPEADFLTTEG
ncbi:dihydroorotate dehydrogenase [Tabrizicola sp.]|uniref:dihydroorotate dehydrogenase n=1 Tax=Tabrizicola sp. TaxID=2005166 RepID=UPI0027371DCD|nr:dihydroorotate dehydrogenase [Tabrizicola sp.]MDP3195016.1 dihydroorotate dehydrogenase [Tabrizicola sp.]